MIRDQLMRLGARGELAAIHGVRLFQSMWPSGGRSVSRVMPDWPDHFIHWMVQLTQKELGHVNAFFQVETVNTGVRMLQTDAASVPQRVYRGRGDRQVDVERTGRLVDEGGNLADLLAYANPLDTGRQLRESAVGSLVLSGNAYWYLQRFGGSKPSELWNLPGHLTRPVPGPKRTIAGYEFNRGGSGNWEPIAAEDVIHFRRFNPEDRPVGVSDLTAVQNAYEAQYFAMLWLREFFRHGGIFPGVWTTDEASSVRYTDAELDDIAKRIHARHSGWDKTFLPLIVQGIKYVAQGMKLSEMDLSTQIGLVDAKIIRALGIPPWRMGIKEGGGALSPGAGSGTDESIYWLSTVSGLVTLLDDVINERLAPLFGRDVHVLSALTEVPAVQQVMLSQAKTHYELTGRKPVETQNEARRAMRLPEDPSEEADSLIPTPTPAFGVAPGDTPSPPGEKPDPEDPKKQTRQARLSASPEREELRSRAAFRLSRYQGRMEALVLERLAEQRGTAIERLRQQAAAQGGHLSRSNGRVRLAIDTTGLMDEPSDKDAARAGRILEDLLRARSVDALLDLEQAAGIALDVELDLQSAQFADFVARQVDRAIRVPDATTRKLLRESLASGLADGEGLDALVGRVNHVFDGRRSNALTIARTETQPAYNFAAMEAWRQSGVVEQQEWLTSRSGLGGRHSEDPEGRYASSDGGRGLDGQERAIGEMFDVGGVPLLYPGDPSGPAGEIVNCVCVLLPVVSEARLSARRYAHLLSGNGAAERNGKGGGSENRIRQYFYAGRRG